MRIKRLRAENFRNITACEVEFSEGVNLLYGKNAQGKTNAIEAIYLFSRGRSHRTADDKELVKIGTEGFRIAIDYESLDGEGSLEYALYGRQRLRKKNGYKLSGVQEMLGSFRSVLFYPDNLNLVKGAPDERRSFLNVALAQCYPVYLSEYQRYKIALENRNGLLKAASKGQYVDELELISWSEAMAKYAAYIYVKRQEYLEALSPFVRSIAFEMSGGRENISLSLDSDIEERIYDISAVEDAYRRILTVNLAKERVVGTSLYGPHRDDVLILINGHPARTIASQGQQRSIVLALKLAEGEVIKDMFGEYPVFLFDDVLSELDSDRRKYVVKEMRDRQVIITSCEGEDVVFGAEKIIEVSEGSYVPARR